MGNLCECRSLNAVPLFLFLLASGPRPAMAAPTSWVVKSGDAVLNVQLSDDISSLREGVDPWISTAIKAVSTYYGRFPVPHTSLNIKVEDGPRIRHGVTRGGQRITIVVGRDATPRDFQNDWMLTHEMLHLAFPDVGDASWMEEGLSDYVEPIARAGIGAWPVERVWGDFVQGFPKGLPEAEDRGLDGTHSWGRTYWGGALFWFLADLQIREETNNRRSLRDALRAVLDAGGDGRITWDPKRVFDIGDAATGTHVLTHLHDEMGPKAMTPDLNALWKRLGVRMQGNQVVFDDTAPLASLRRAMTTLH